MSEIARHGDSIERPSRRRWALLLMAVWMLAALLDVSRLLVFSPYRQYWQAIVLWRLPTWMLWTILTPAIGWLGRRFPIERPRWLRAAAVHAACALLFVALHAVVSGALMVTVVPQELAETEIRFLQAAATTVIMEAPVVVVLYAAILGLYQGIRYYRRLQRQELAASRLEAQLAQARLDNLRMQLHPHFLFNALNAVATLVRRGARRRAVEVLAGLSDLLRQALAKSSEQWVTLQDELQLVAKYLALEEVRFQDRMRVEQHIDPQAREALVPTLILQPLVENAVRHGIAGRRSAGLIQIRARVEAADGAPQEARLILEVLDDGPGPLSESPSQEGGVGLSNTRARLSELFGSKARLQLSCRQAGGAAARLEFPLRRRKEVQSP